MNDTITVPIAILGTAVLGLFSAGIRLWSDVQQLKTQAADFAEACRKVAAHETEIALLKATVTRLETIPDKIDRLTDLIREKV